MHFLYIVGTGSRWQNNELRYSLRSLQQNFKSSFDVWVIGHKPPWLTGVTHIPCEDHGSNPIENICLKLLYALDVLPPTWTLMNDDFYLMTAMDKIPVFHGEPMAAWLRQTSNRKGVHIDAFRATYNELLKTGKRTPVRFDLHLPFPMATGSLKWLPIEWQTGRFSLKNAYGNLIYDPVVCLPHHEVKSPLAPRTADFWSTPNDVHPMARHFLESRFPEVCRYERA